MARNTRGYRQEKMDESYYPRYWQFVRERAAALASDGCSGVPDYFLDACLRHDIHFRTGKTVFNNVLITFSEANALMRDYIQEHSRFGRFSPMAAWRYVGLVLFSYPVWLKARRKDGIGTKK